MPYRDLGRSPKRTLGRGIRSVKGFSVQFHVPFAAHGGRALSRAVQARRRPGRPGHEPRTLSDTRTAHACAPAAGQGIGRQSGASRARVPIRVQFADDGGDSCPVQRDERRLAGRQRPRRRNGRGHPICSGVPIGHRLRDRRVPRWTDRCDRHYGPMYRAIGRGCLLSPRSAVGAQAARPAVRGSTRSRVRLVTTFSTPSRALLASRHPSAAGRFGSAVGRPRPRRVRAPTFGQTGCRASIQSVC